MKNFLVIIILVVAIWFVYNKIMENQPKKESNAFTNYTDNLKKSEDKAKAVENTANLTVIKQAISSYKNTEGKYPASLNDLVAKNYIDHIPYADFSYDPNTGEVSIK